MNLVVYSLSLEFGFEFGMLEFDAMCTHKTNLSTYSLCIVSVALYRFYLYRVMSLLPIIA